MEKRLNIGFLVDDLDNYFSAQCCKGAELAAKALDANLYILPGRYIGAPDSRYGFKDYEYQYNSVFRLVNERNIDVLYVLFGTICSRATEEEKEAFIANLPDVPKVFLFASRDGVNSVMFDNKSGLSAAIEHLIERHSAKTIGFVSGPLSNKEAVQRLETYRETLENHNIGIDESLIAYGDFTENCPEVIDELLDRHPELDSIVFANDRMALCGYKVLERRGLTPGKDILVTGYDNDDISNTMSPPLTTVDASSADLTYQAVINAPHYIKAEETSLVETQTHLIQRKSCGCCGVDVETMKSRIGLKDDMSDLDAAVTDYLLGIFADDEEVTEIGEALYEFFVNYNDYLKSGGDSAILAKLHSSFDSFLHTSFLEYIPIEKIFNVLQILKVNAFERLSDNDKKFEFLEMFTEIYRDMAYTDEQSGQAFVNKRDRLERLITKESADMLYASSDEGIQYEKLLYGVEQIGFNGMYIYAYQGNTSYTSTDTWRCPSSVLLKALNDINGPRSINEEQQLIRTEQIFANEYMDETHRKTMVAYPMFVGIDLFGVLVFDTDCSNLNFIAPIAQQMSITVRSIVMLDVQNKARQELQVTLEKFMKDNSLLDEIAKSDELTGLYNRRGFINNAENVIKNPNNVGKTALVCYADMDNLKMVNDKFGHDEGDFAIKTIADVLREAFRTNDIVGRMGGDEFVVLALINGDSAVDVIKPRIEKITQEKSDKAAKPYPIAVSTGFCTFECGSDIDIYEKLDLADAKLYEEKQEKKKKNGSYR